MCKPLKRVWARWCNCCKNNKYTSFTDRYRQTMKQIKTLLALAILSMTYLCGQAQTAEAKVVYTYDNAGNRTSRMTTITLKNAKLDEEEPVVPPVEEPWGERKLTVFPNPTKGNLAVMVTGGSAEDAYTFTLHNMSGGKLLDGRFVGQGQQPVPMERLEPGTYILIVSRGKDRHTFKVIKE